MLVADKNCVLGKRFVYDMTASHETNFVNWSMLADAEAELDSNFGVVKYTQVEKERLFERQYGHKRIKGF